MLFILCLILFPFLSIEAACSPAQFPNIASKAKNELTLLTPEEMDQDWKLNDYFGSVYIINLVNRPERLEFATNQLKAIGCNQFEVFKAVDGRKDVDEKIWKKMWLNWANIDLTTEEGQNKFNNQRKGEAGCYLSHYYIIKKVKECYDKALVNYQEAKKRASRVQKAVARKELLKYRSVVILEDDNGFGIVSQDKKSASLASVGKLFRSALAELPVEWDMLYFVTYSRTPAPNQNFTEHLVKVNGGYLANAYAVNYRMYDTLVKELSKIEDPLVERVLPVDSLFSILHKTNHCYAIFPSIAYQSGGISAINSSFSADLLQFQPMPPMN